MPIKSDLKERIETFLGEPIVSNNSVSGGCIADSRILSMASGKRYFLKSHAHISGMFVTEANGLKELSKPACIRVPEVVLADENFLLLENIEQGGKATDFFETFGAQLAKMHRYTAPAYGFFEDNFIGASPQYNMAEGAAKNTWSEFYFQYRLLPQLKMAEQRGAATTELRAGVSRIENKITSILKGSEEAPSLLHGDLWGGNYLCDNRGAAVLIDPAVYYGHRETDLAMTTMFGGFSPEFYEAYQQEYPLAEGWEYRQHLYLLYHYFNHFNLFGSGYYGNTLRLLNYYV